jgi:hypothetical protein
LSSSAKSSTAKSARNCLCKMLLWSHFAELSFAKQKGQKLK